MKETVDAQPADATPWSWRMGRTSDRGALPPSQRPVEEEGILFVLDLARALHRAGMPAHSIEDAMLRVSRRLGLECRFMSMPTGMLAGFGPVAAQRTCLIRVDPADVDLERLSDLDETTDLVISGKLAAAEGAARAEAIELRAPRYGAAITILSFAVAAVTTTALFRGGWREMGVAALGSLIAGCLVVLGGRAPALARVVPLVSGLACGALGELFFGKSDPSSALIATLGGLIVLLPGLTLTIAMTELATGNLVSGTARAAGALSLLMQLGIGIAVGVHVAEHAHLFANLGPLAPLPALAQPIAVGVAGLSFTVLFRARPRDVGIIAAAGAAAFVGARIGTLLLGGELGVFFGALLVGVIANLFARWWRRPSAIIVLPGIIVLVPGSLGLRSVTSLLHQDVVTGVGTAFSVGLIAIALTAGLLVASLAVSPRRPV